MEGDSLITAERRGWAQGDDQTRIVEAEEIEGLALARVVIVMRGRREVAGGVWMSDQGALERHAKAWRFCFAARAVSGRP